jgi:uncharacterized lipoprotein YehR (DUF1307 family)
MSRKLVTIVVFITFSLALAGCQKSREEKKEDRASQAAAEMGYGAKIPKPKPSGKF